MIKGRKITKYLENALFSKIIRVFKYKMKWNVKRLIVVSTYYPSSQICNRCGNRNKEVKKLNIRLWECEKCGSRHDRDINSS